MIHENNKTVKVTGVKQSTRLMVNSKKCSDISSVTSYPSMSVKKLKQSSLNNISQVLPIPSTSEKKRTSRGLPQPFKTMLCRLLMETKRKQHPDFEYRVGGQGTTGCFLSCGIQRRKVSLDDLLSFTATLKFSVFSLYTLYTSVEPRLLEL